MDEDRDVRAVFGIGLTVTTTSGGSVRVVETPVGGAARAARSSTFDAICAASGSPCNLAVPVTVRSLTATATATADDGYHLSAWGGACAGTAVTESCTVALDAQLTNPGKAISATFAEDDDNDTPDVTIAAVTASVTEGTNASFTVTRTGATTAALAVTVSVTQRGTFIDGPAPTSVRIDVNAASATLSVATDDDEDDEPNGSVTATVTDGTAYDLGTPAAATVNVVDDDGVLPTQCTDPKPAATDVTTSTETGTEVDTANNRQRPQERTVTDTRTRSVSCEESTGEWLTGTWSAAVRTWGSWSPTGPWVPIPTQCTDPKPAATDATTSTETGTEVDTANNRQRPQERTVTDTRTRSVSCEESTGEWLTGTWSAAVRTWGSWSPTGPWVPIPTPEPETCDSPKPSTTGSRMYTEEVSETMGRAKRDGTVDVTQPQTRTRWSAWTANG